MYYETWILSIQIQGTIYHYIYINKHESAHTCKPPYINRHICTCTHYIYTPTYNEKDTTCTQIICNGAHIQHIPDTKYIFTSALVQEKKHQHHDDVTTCSLIPTTLPPSNLPSLVRVVGGSLPMSWKRKYIHVYPRKRRHQVLLEYLPWNWLTYTYPKAWC